MSESIGEFRSRRLSVLSVVCTLMILPASAFAAEDLVAGRADEAVAVKAIEKLGGTVTVDDEQPGKPVVAVTLRLTQVTDAGLKDLKEFKHLQTLDLSYTQVTNDGLKELKDLQSLRTLGIAGTKVTDMGLKKLKDLQTLTNLEYLDLRGTKVTAAGVDSLHKALPNCRIQSDFPSSGDDRKAAEWVLSIGGKVEIRVDAPQQKPREVTAANDLPAGNFQLLRVDLYGNTKVTDAGLANLKEMRNLTHLELGATPLTDAGVKELKDLESLQTLKLNATKITGAGLKELKDLKSLQTLELYGTKLTDTGLGELKDLKSLQTLDLGGTQITDAGLKELKDLKSLQTLDLGSYSTQVTDGGVKQLQSELPKLKIVIRMQRFRGIPIPRPEPLPSKFGEDLRRAATSPAPIDLEKMAAVNRAMQKPVPKDDGVGPSSTVVGVGAFAAITGFVLALVAGFRSCRREQSAR